MTKYILQTNESLIMKSEKVLYGGVLSTYTNELILTNMNIVLIIKGVFGNSKDIRQYPIDQIKIFNGQPQALLTKQSNGRPQLEVYFSHGQEAFGFDNKKEVNQWVNNINKLVTGASHEFEKIDSKAIPGTEYIAETLKDTFDTFIGGLGLKSKIKGDKPTENVVKKCTACGAPISGYKGQIVSCQYCDTNQNL